VEVEAVIDHGVDEPLFGTEEVIERRHLHTDRVAHRAQGEVLAWGGGDEVRRGGDQPLPCITRRLLRHAVTVPDVASLQFYISSTHRRQGCPSTPSLARTSSSPPARRTSAD